MGSSVVDFRPDSEEIDFQPDKPALSKADADKQMSAAVKGPASPSTAPQAPLKLDTGINPEKPLSTAEQEFNRNQGPRSKFVTRAKPNANVTGIARTTQQDIADAGAPDKIDFVPDTAPTRLAAHGKSPSVKDVQEVDTDPYTRAIRGNDPNEFEHGDMPGSFEGHPENLAGWVEEGPIKAGRGIGRVAANVSPSGFISDPNEVATGASEAMQGIGMTAAPTLPFSAAAAPISVATGLATGYGASKLADKALEKTDISPEQKQALSDAAWFLPSLLGETVGLRGAMNERAVGASAFGDRVAAAAGRTPEGGVGIAAKVGNREFSKTFGGNGRPQIEAPTIEGAAPSPVAQAETNEAMAALARQRTAENMGVKIASGQPVAPVTPPPPPAPQTPISGGQVRPELLDGIAKMITSLPAESRPQAIMMAHDRMTQALMQQGRVVGPDGKLHIVDSEKAAAKLAQTWLNDKVDEIDQRSTATPQQEQKPSEVKNPKGLIAKMKAAIAKASVGSEQERVVQETKGTIDKQISALKDGNIDVVFIPAGSDYIPKLPDGFRRADVDAKFPGGGTYFYNEDAYTAREIKDAAKQGTHGELLGHVQSKAEIAQAPDTVVVQALAEDGTPIQDSEVAADRQDLIQKQAEILQQRHPQATVEVKPTDQVITDRLKDGQIVSPRREGFSKPLTNKEVERIEATTGRPYRNGDEVAFQKVRLSGPSVIHTIEGKAAPVKDFINAGKKESFKKGDAVQFTDNDGQKRTGTVKHINELAARVTDSEGKSYEIAPSKISGRGYMAGEQIRGHEGKETELAVPSGKMPSRYRVVEAKDLKPSHDAMTFAPHVGYPSGVQERTYHTSKEAQSRVIQQAQNYEPAYTVNTNPDAVNGPPVVTPDGVVLGGNSRAMSTQRLYGEGKGATYRDYLKKNADQFGVKPEDIDKLKEPMLVREVKAPGDHDAMRRLGSELNKSMTGALGVSEKAVSAGKSIAPQTFDDIVRMMDDMGFETTLREFLQQHGGEVLKMLQKDGVITDRERPQFADTASGGLSDEGRTFVERALLGSVVDDPVLMERTPKNVLDKIGNSLGDLAVLKARSDDYNILAAVRASLAEHADIAQRGITTDDYLKQRNMFAEGRNPMVDAITELLAQKPRQVKDAIRQFTQDAKFDQEGQATMGLSIEPDAASAFNAAFNTDMTSARYERALKEAGEKSQSLYRAAPLAQKLISQIESNKDLWERLKDDATEGFGRLGLLEADRVSDGGMRFTMRAMLERYVRGELKPEGEPLMDEALAETNWEDLAKFMDAITPLPQAMRDIHWQEYDPNQEWMKDYEDRLEEEREKTGLYRTDELHDRKYESIKIEEAPAQGGLFGEDTKMYRVSATDENGDVARYLVSEHELDILKNNPSFRAAMNGESQGALFRGEYDEARFEKILGDAENIDIHVSRGDGNVPRWIAINEPARQLLSWSKQQEIVGAAMSPGDAYQTAVLLRELADTLDGKAADKINIFASAIEHQITENGDAGVVLVSDYGAAEGTMATLAEELFHSAVQLRPGGGDFHSTTQGLGLNEHPTVQKLAKQYGDDATAEAIVDVWNGEHRERGVSDADARTFADEYWKRLQEQFGDRPLEDARELQKYLLQAARIANIDGSRWTNGPAQEALDSILGGSANETVLPQPSAGQIQQAGAGGSLETSGGLAREAKQDGSGTEVAQGDEQPGREDAAGEKVSTLFRGKPRIDRLKNLSPEEQGRESEIVAHAEKNFDKLVDDYIAKNTTDGQLTIVSDNAKELLPHFGTKEEQNANSEITHPASAAIAEGAWRKAIAQPVNPERPTVMFVTGMQGSGKSQAIAKEAMEGVGIVYERSLADKATAERFIREAEQSGRHAAIHFVYTREPATALDRAITRAKEDGRTVNIRSMAKIYAGVPRTLDAIKGELPIGIVENTGKDAMPRNLDSLKRISDNWSEEKVYDTLRKELDRKHAAGEISDQLYKQFLFEQPSGAEDSRQGLRANAQQPAEARGNQEVKPLRDITLAQFLQDSRNPYLETYQKFKKLEAIANSKAGTVAPPNVRAATFSDKPDYSLAREDSRQSAIDRRETWEREAKAASDAAEVPARELIDNYMSTLSPQKRRFASPSVDEAFRKLSERRWESIKKQSSEAGFAKADIPVALAEGLGHAASAVKSFIENEADKVAKSRDLQGGIDTLDSQFSADVLRGVKLLKQLPGTAKDQEQIYFSREENVKLTPEQKEIAERWSDPLREDSQQKYVEMAQGDAPIQNYVHRQVMGRGGLIDRIVAKAKGVGRNPLNTSNPASKHRTMMALESKDGKRKLVSIKGGKILDVSAGGRELGSTRSIKTGQSLLDKRMAPIDKKLEELNHELKFEKDDKMKRKVSHEIAYLTKQRDKLLEDAGEEDLTSSNFTDKNGTDWKVVQASTREIEARTDLKYYHNDFASSLSNWLITNRAYRAFKFLEEYKDSPEFATVAMKREGNNPPKDWRPTKLQQFNQYVFEPHVAEVLDRMADRMTHRPDLYDKLGEVLKTSIFYNPTMHLVNVGVHAVVEKGVTGWAIPTNWPVILRAGMKAFRAVATQNDDFLAMLDAGGPLQSQRFETDQFSKLFYEKMAKELQADTSKAEMVAKAVGLSVPRLIALLYRMSSKALWGGSDIMYMQAVYEKMAHGMSMKAALAETSKHIPDYRLPTRIFNSKRLGDLMNNRTATMFSAYHYGMLKSFGQMFKSVAGANGPGPGEERNEAGRTAWGERGHGLDVAAMGALVVCVLYPALDELLKRATGEKRAEMRRAGAATMPYALYQLYKGEKSPTEVAEAIATPAVLAKGAAELAFNRDLRTGRKVYDTHAPAGTIAKQVGGKAAEMLSPVGSAVRASRSDVEMKKVLYGMAGVSFPLHGADKLAAEIAMNKMGNDAPDPEHLAHLALKHDLLAAARDGDYSKLEQAEQEGKITTKEGRMLMRESLEEPLMITVKSFTADELLKVYEAANDEQRAMLEPMLQRKLVKLRGLNPEKADELEAAASK